MSTVAASLLDLIPDADAALVMACTFAAVALFVLAGVGIFASGWQSYEQRYMADAERSLDAIYLTVPPQVVVYLSAVCFVILSLLWLWLLKNLWVALGFGLAGLGVPKLLLWWLKRRRDLKFDRQLVEALSNLGNSLKAGFSLPQALNLLSQEMDNPMRQELRLVVREMQVGADMETALQHLYERMPGEDLDLVITAILISREIGGDLTEIFDNISGTIRARHRIEGRIKALTSQGRLQGIVMCCIPPGILASLSYIAPALVRPLFAQPVGWLILGVIVALMAAGTYTIHRIVSIEV